nr:zonular occludens toxin domain-containing protein [uncultured Campylobacter sp.]
MSLTYIVGNPGSGKTYLAVNKLYECFISDTKTNKKNYRFAYTNINEFDFSKSDKIKKLDIDEFKANLSILYSYYKSKVDDTELIKHAKELNLCNVLIVIDECHSTIFSQKGDKVLIWWLTYHRHLYQDIYLITQNLSLVDSAYKKIAEFFYKAVDGSKRLFSSRLRYVLFNSPTMYQKRDIVVGGGISLKFNPEIYKLYHSGDETKHKSLIKYYFLVSFFLIFLIVVLFLFFKDYFNTSDKSTRKVSSISTSPVVVNQIYANTAVSVDKNVSMAQIQYSYFVRCIYTDCVIDGYAPFTYKYFSLMISQVEPIYIEYKSDTKGFLEIYAYFDKPVFENLKKEVKNEKDSFSTSSVVKSAFSK